MSKPTIAQLGKYRILGEIGKGGFATVYRALDTTLDREVALKVLDPLLMRDATWVTRFQREAKAVARLKHPHIVTIYEIGEAEGRLHIAMELVEGPALNQRIAEQGRLPWDEAMEILSQVAGALDYAHSQKVLHRDLKPANILLDPLKGALLTDFGFARLVGESTVSVSISGGIVGTPAYIAPEVWDGEGTTAQTDLYALACIFYEMVIGQVLFCGPTPMAVMRAHDQGARLPEEWPEGVPGGVVDIMRKALAAQGQDRYDNAVLFVTALKGADRSQQGADLVEQGYQQRECSGSSPTIADSVQPKERSTGTAGSSRVAEPDLSSAQAYHTQGWAQYRKKEYDAAIADFSQAIDLDPNSAEAYRGRAWAQYQKGEYSAAIADFSQAIELDPTSVKAYRWRGWAHYYNKEYDAAIADFSQTIELDPDSGSAYEGRGWAHYRKQEYDAAVADFSNVIRLDSNCSSGYRGRGWALHYMGEYEKAYADFAQAIELDPHSASAYRGRGWALYYMKKYDMAIADFAQAVKLNPESASAHRGFGWACYHRKEYDAAIAGFSLALQVAPQDESSQEGLQEARKRKKEMTL